LVLVNQQVAPFLDQVLVHLYKASADDEATVSRAALQCAEMVGAFLDTGLVLGLLARHLGLKLDGTSGARHGVEEIWAETRIGRAVTRTVQDVEAGVKNFAATTTENKRQVFAVLAHLLRPALPGVQLDANNVQLTVRFLEEGSQHDELLPWVLGALRALLAAGGTSCCDSWPRLFDLLLRMRSGEECDPGTVDACMDRLAELNQKTRRALYEEHLSTRLGELLLGAEFELWEERSPKRHVLETLLRNAGAAGAPHIGALIPVFARQVRPEDASVPARVDLLGLIHFLVNEEDEALSAAVHAHAPALLNEVLLPNCTWRAGQSNNKIRKGGMVCLHSLLRRHLVDAAALNSSFSDLLPVLKSCLDDAWSPDNRMIALLVLSCTLQELTAQISADQLKEVYPELLKRLDDSNDKIRATVCQALLVFFGCMPPTWSRTLYEYILRTLFVHLDDPNPEIHEGIYRVLEAAAHHDYTTFISEAQSAAARSTHPRECEELCRLAQNLRLAAANEAVEGEAVQGEQGTQITTACMD